MTNANLDATWGGQPAPTVDLNSLLFAHPAATFIFQLSQGLAIVDRAVAPTGESLVMVEHKEEFEIEPYHGQLIFGVVTYLIKPIR